MIAAEALLCAQQEQVIRANYVKNQIHMTNESPTCRLYGKKGESVEHLATGCENWLRENLRENTTMKKRKSVGTFVRRVG